MCHDALMRLPGANFSVPPRKIMVRDSILESKHSQITRRG